MSWILPDPELIDDIPVEELAAAMAQVSVLSARLAARRDQVRAGDEEQPHWITTRELAALLDVSPNWVLRHMRKDAVHVGPSKVLWDRRVVARWLNGDLVPPAP